MSATSWVTPELRAQLRTDAWFGSLSSGLENDLLELATPKRLKVGEHLFFRGDVADGIYAVLEGTLRISGVTESGKEAILSMVEPPMWLGEIALFDHLPRTHNAVADVATRLLYVPMGPLNELLSRRPVYWRDFGVLMSLKVRFAFIGMEDLALLPADMRLTRRLVMLTFALGKEGHCVLPISQSQLGMMLGLSRQTTNQILQNLQDQGVVQIAYGRIEVLDRARLADVAGLSCVDKALLGQIGPSRAPAAG
ncbi:Crp/Fnr family transcriptional regulator [Aquabacterium sp.]|uniref:Crp/Fnr family transcriptional regulator n=1 Tax=Aquabacterium sp. TaxID=1872578 RepID=UPI0024890057|nr:Crp/Fnr family transcriptional regulator [Aquabacterium sp.]MDI1260075.1 Crp/Fnr family transcriptional regulator [Aquabacterium sp.]